VSGRALRWAVVLLDLDSVEGHEQAGLRPVLVVSYEPFYNLGLLTVVPITSARTEPRLPGDVPVPAGEAALARLGGIVCSQIRTVSVLRIRNQGPGRVRYVTSPTIRAQVREALGHHLALDLRPELDNAEGGGMFVVADG